MLRIFKHCRYHRNIYTGTCWM